jgi:hypothetical protein
VDFHRLALVEYAKSKSENKIAKRRIGFWSTSIWTGKGDRKRGQDYFSKIVPIRKRSGATHPAVTGPAGAVSIRGLISGQVIAAQRIGSRHSAIVSSLFPVAENRYFTSVHYLVETRVPDAGKEEGSGRCSVPISQNEPHALALSLPTSLYP